ncbi:BTAD domain-containing putative transcriptional regulator [Streptomyces sp. NPDC059568]|uniref:AfsR/SARP family transcriptional regulator n=1 Tax=Streptomyces sp. NPDC059568 TaxID=3346868 RepID=UPI00368281DE
MHFNVLGPLEVIGSKGPVPVRGVRRQALLAAMLFHTGQVISVDRLVDAVWPGQAPRSAVENIRTYVSELRSQLRRAGDRPRLESHPGAYRLRADPEELDLLRFTALAAAGRRAMRDNDFAGAAELLGRATGLWRGVPLSGLKLSPGMETKMTTLEEQRRVVQTGWIRSRMALGEYKELVPLLRELTAEQPLDESTWCCLAIALQATGRTGDALAACAQARQALVNELGIEPGAELQQIQASLLRGETPPRPHAADRPSSPSSGAAGGRRAAVPRQLPSPVRGFTGRQKELRRLGELMNRPASSGAGAGTGTHGAGAPGTVIAVYGPPGAGKTALAVTAAAGAQQSFPDGQLYADLGGSTRTPATSSAALAALLGGLGIDPRSLPGNLEGRRALYRSLVGESRMLVVLDDVADAAQVDPLIPNAQSVVVMTCRRWLASLTPDVNLVVDPLPSADGVVMLGTILGTARLESDAEAAEAVAVACGGLPLALRIAGMRLAARPHLPLRAMARQLSAPARVLDELSMSDLSVRSRFTAAYEELSPEARLCFHTIGLAEPGIHTPASAAGLLRVPVHVADRYLEQLVHHCLLTTGGERDGTTHYSIPRLLHAYARESAARQGLARFETTHTGSGLRPGEDIRHRERGNRSLTLLGDG